MVLFIGLVLLDGRCSVADRPDDGGRGRPHEDRVEYELEHDQHSSELASGSDVAEPDSGHGGQREVEGVRARGQPLELTGAVLVHDEEGEREQHCRQRQEHHERVDVLGPAAQLPSDLLEDPPGQGRHAHESEQQREDDPSCRLIGVDRNRVENDQHPDDGEEQPHPRLSDQQPAPHWCAIPTGRWRSLRWPRPHENRDEDVVQLLGPPDLEVGSVEQVAGGEEQPLVLPSAESAVGPHQAFEGRDLEGRRIHGAVDIDVGRRGHLHRPKQRPRRMRRERSQRVHPGDEVVVKKPISVGTDHDVSLRAALHSDEADSRSRSQAGEQPGPAFLDLLADQALGSGDVHQAEVPRSEHDEVTGRRVLVRACTVLQTCGRTSSGMAADGVASKVVHDGSHPAPALDVLLERDHVLLGELAAQVAQRLSVEVRERRLQGLPVVRNRRRSDTGGARRPRPARGR